MYQQNPGYPGYPGQQPYAYNPPPPGMYPPHAGSYAPPPPDSSGIFNAEPSTLFSEKPIRQAFVSKVFSILTIQLIFTSILIGTFVLNEGTKKYFGTPMGQVWLLLGMAIFLVAYLILACVESARRSTPCNMILLCILTFGYGFEAAVISCRYETQVVLFAFLATGASCFLIALFAKTTSLDLTNCGMTLLIIGLAHMVVVILALVILGPSKSLSLVLAISGALLVSLYLIFDLQLIMGGRKCELSPEEYILAAVLLYVDIIQIFMYMLEIISHLTKDN